ncbi:DUF202 domain-containing protein [Nocardioides sp. NBC_00163]|uniref:YidH family protein n=1 Tax=Nocardioides sp. NBC_00163 TaxID=2975999 RepID=UPI0032552338
MVNSHPHSSESGEDLPDYRFLLANERTLLAWIRTSLAMSAAGAGVVILSATEHLPYAAVWSAATLGAVGGLLAVDATIRWRRSSSAICAGAPLPPLGLRSVVLAAAAVMACCCPALFALLGE